MVVAWAGDQWSDPMTVFPELPDQKFGIIYADPPWDYRGQLQHAGVGSGDTGGAVRHYPTVTLSDLKKLDVSGIAEDDCLLFMWATNPHLDQAIELGKAWGFGVGDRCLRVGQGTGQPRVLHLEPMRTVPGIQKGSDTPRRGGREMFVRWSTADGAPIRRSPTRSGRE